jgi:nucleotide-binding universal stress UspA family protein
MDENSVTKRRIVVGTDGSPSSSQAMMWAAREARRRGASLDVVHAWSPPIEIYPGSWYLDPSVFHEEAEAVLDEAVQSVPSPCGLPLDVQGHLCEGPAATRLVETAAEAQLLVVGSRGRGGFTGLLLGSVSRECVHKAACPVVVVPPAWKGEEQDRIVVGVDGSESSEVALEWAIAEAAMRGSRLDVVNAYGSHRPVSVVGTLNTFDGELLEKDSRSLLDEMVVPLVAAADPRPRSVAEIPSPDTPAVALLAAARGADLLVVGSRGRGEIRGLVLGSVSEQCVHHAPCPVVVVRHPVPAR